MSSNFLVINMSSVHTTKLFDDVIDNLFLRPMRPNVKPPHLDEPILSSYFYINSSPDKEDYQQYFFELYDNIIVCKRAADRNEVAYMDMNYAFMKKTEGTHIVGVKYYGLKFIKKKAYEELLHHDPKVIEEWYKALSKFCVLINFRLNYASVKVLGKGRFAKVYLVQRVTDKKLFAVKVFNKAAVITDTQERKCLIYEMKMMRVINNKRILKTYEIFEGENYIYCVCEYYEGDNLLNAIVKKGPQPEAKALTILSQLLDGLVYLHSRNIIHRDLKPENIIVRSTLDINIVIVDLGFATYESEYQNLFARCGTPGYVAPEVLADKPYNCKADVFSIGVIFYMILTGKSPFSGCSYKEIITKNMKADFDLNFEQFDIKVSNDGYLISFRPVKGSD